MPTGVSAPRTISTHGLPSIDAVPDEQLDPRSVGSVERDADHQVLELLGRQRGRGIGADREVQVDLDGGADLVEHPGHRRADRGRRG